VILLNNTNFASVKLLAECIRNTIELHTLACDRATIKITASIGVSFGDHDKKILKFKKCRSITRTGGGIITKINEPEFIQTGKKS
jgi:GGDEF domain-containing protein